MRDIHISGKVKTLITIISLPTGDREVGRLNNAPWFAWDCPSLKVESPMSQNPLNNGQSGWLLTLEDWEVQVLICSGQKHSQC